MPIQAPNLSARSFKSLATISTGTFGVEAALPGPNSSGRATVAVRSPAFAAPCQNTAAFVQSTAGETATTLTWSRQLDWKPWLAPRSTAAHDRGDGDKDALAMVDELIERM